MKTHGLFIIFLILISTVFAQDIPGTVDVGKTNPYPFLTSQLWQIHEKAISTSASQAINLAIHQSIPIKKGTQKIYVEIIRGDNDDLELTIPPDLWQSIPGVEVSTVWKNRASVWIKVSQILAVGKKLPAGYRLRHVITPAPDNEGPSLTNSQTYNVSGGGGDGLLIAIIDSGFDMLTEARSAGAAPTATNTTWFNYTGSGLEETTRHGTGCLETVFDHAPNAEYYIFKTNSISDLGTAVTVCINNGINIISHSISRYNTGWADNTGGACAAAADASSHGILFFTSSGNRNGTHWQGSFYNPDSDNWHNWSGGDEQNDFTINGTVFDRGAVRTRLQWNSSSSTDHYDLYLYENGTNTLLGSSTNTNDFEEIIYETNSTKDVYLAVRKKTVNPPEFELFNHHAFCTNFEYASTTGSSTSPSNSTAANVISVGALPLADYGSAPGVSGIIASYSSRGPSNSGNLAPDICAPTNTATVAYGGSFGGTSCSTPNAAGTAAAFWSAHEFLNASGVRQIIFSKADLYKDWGSTGADNLYGRGGVYLYDYHIDNRYILAGAANIFGSPALPYIGISSVDNLLAVPANLRMIYLDVTDTSPGSGEVINKPMLYKSIPGTVIN